MKLTLEGKKPIVIDKKYFNIESEGRNQNTPYTNEFLKGTVNSDFKYRLRGYTNLQTKIDGLYNSYFDLMGGVGLTGRIYNEGVSDIRFNDFSLDCVNIISQNYPEASVYSEDMFNFNYGDYRPDLILIDFNDFTYKKYLDKYKSVLSDAMDASSKYVIINDCSVFYLRYGQKAYEVYSNLLGKKITSKDEFFEEMRSFYKVEFPDWNLTDVETFGSSSLMLFRKDVKSLDVNVMKESGNLLTIE